MDVKSVLCDIVDFFKVLIKSKYGLKKKIPYISNPSIIRILGNGQSLNLQSFSTDNIDYMVVNRHVLSDNYIDLKPKYYVLADPHFFKHKEGLSVINEIFLKTSWPLFLFLPYSKEASNIIKEFSSSLISIKFYNSSSYSHRALFSNYMYNNQLAMPVLQNVIVACIMLSINMNYKKIELFGVEHNWLPNIFVGEDNLVYQYNPHFYDKTKQKVKLLKDIQCATEYPYYLILSQYSRMFQSYWEIREYLKSINSDIRIVNKTKGSFIDAFERE